MPKLESGLCIPPICVRVKIRVRFVKVWVDGVKDVQDKKNVYFRRQIRDSIEKEYEVVKCDGCRCKHAVDAPSPWQTIPFTMTNVPYPPDGTKHALRGTYEIRARITQGFCR